MSLASPCFAPSSEEYSRERMRKLMSLPLEDKIIYAQVKIRQFYIAMKGKVYVSYSGGKDSTVLLHLVRSLYPDVKGVYSDTGLEYPEIREFVMKTPNVDIIHPKISFKKVIDIYGYPVIGKEVANYIKSARNGAEYSVQKMQDTGDFGFGHYAWVMDAPFKIGADCCYHLKKKPMHDYQKETGLFPIIGTRTEESRLRQTKWIKTGDVITEGDHIQANPLSIFTEEDIWAYIRKFNLPYSDAYKIPGITRTGCIFCGFGIMQDKNRFLTLKATHPKLWEYCMKPRERGGLGMREVCDFLGVPTGYEQMSLVDFAEGKQ